MAVASAGPLYKQSAPCSRQTNTPTPHHSIFIGWMLFLMPNQQCQSTEDIGIKENLDLDLKSDI